MSAERLRKLQPDRDLQCYFERPSAIAAISEAQADRFVLSGTWRQQLDWAVIEWNRDNVIEHPALRNFPDGDLSGIRLTYSERRTNCIPVDSDLYPTVDWNVLRVWAADSQGVERVYRVPLLAYAQPVEGAYQCASAEFVMTGQIRAGDHIGIAILGQHHTRQVFYDDTIQNLVRDIAQDINAYSDVVVAEYEDDRLRLFYVGQTPDGNRATLATSRTGENGNRVGVYGHVTPGSTLAWETPYLLMSGGTSPLTWQYDLPFGALLDADRQSVPTDRVRKLRWTYAASLQNSAFNRTEFEVRFTNWTVSGTGLDYEVAGPGSRRIEDDDASVEYSGAWTSSAGNFSGGAIAHTTEPGARAVIQYYSPQEHALYLGTRRAFSSGRLLITVDGATQLVDLRVGGEDVLSRLPLGRITPGQHVVRLEHADTSGVYLYFDFLEIAVPNSDLPEAEPNSIATLATDWDTDHSLAIAPERTAWLMKKLGFTGRANHYTGALWFYELLRKGHQYASAEIYFEGAPEMSRVTSLMIGRYGEERTRIDHLNLAGDTAETLAKAFEFEINRGSAALWARAENNILRLYSRGMGVNGNSIEVTAEPSSGNFRVVCSSGNLTGGIDGQWVVDLAAEPRINRAARDWSRSFYRALAQYNIEVTAAFSMELQHGDTSLDAGIAQRYPGGEPALLNTPALQTNFSPESTAYWQGVYRCMAEVMREAGVPPYLQFGEVQWWYFPDQTGMPFYDVYTKSRFRSAHGREMKIIRRNDEQPDAYAEELRFLSDLIGEFTLAVMTHTRAAVPGCRFEVLFPPDVNETALNEAANYPQGVWTPAVLDCLKTESFTYTYQRDLNASRRSMRFGIALGFPPDMRSHLIGISDPISPWKKEATLAASEGVESVVLFALDQFCLIGYPLDVWAREARSAKMG